MPQIDRTWDQDDQEGHFLGIEIETF